MSVIYLNHYFTVLLTASVKYQAIKGATQTFDFFFTGQKVNKMGLVSYIRTGLWNYQFLLLAHG